MRSGGQGFVSPQPPVTAHRVTKEGGHHRSRQLPLTEDNVPESKAHPSFAISRLRPVPYDANTYSNSVRLQSATQLFYLSLTNIFVTKCLTALARNTSIKSK